MNEYVVQVVGHNVVVFTDVVVLYEWFRRHYLGFGFEVVFIVVMMATMSSVSTRVVRSGRRVSLMFASPMFAVFMSSIAVMSSVVTNRLLTQLIVFLEIVVILTQIQVFIT